jgi:hypothetical protein
MNAAPVMEPPPLPAPAPGDGTLSPGEIIGYSPQGNPIFCLPRGNTGAPLKILILAGQHGDERPARQTVEAFLNAPVGQVIGRLPNCQIAVIFEANPDGRAARTRVNADGIDLNRDHQLLRSNETTAIHQFIRQWQPKVILDLHSYPSRRQHLLERNVVLDHDVFLDVPTHPAIGARNGSVAGREVLRGLLQALKAREICAERYTIVEPTGRVRHSTADVADARNGLALRYGVFTVLVENRQPRRDESPEERHRLRTVQARALWTILEWLDRNQGMFPSWSAAKLPTQGSPVQVRFKYMRHTPGLRLACRNADEARPVNVTFWRYCASVITRRTVLLPLAYAVPEELETLRAVLGRHGFASLQCGACDFRAVERLRIEAANPSRQPGRAAAAPVVSPHPLTFDLDRYEIFPVRQNGGEALAVFLEPESQHGLHRFPELGLPLVAASWYPVLRVFEGRGPGVNHLSAAAPPAQPGAS